MDVTKDVRLPTVLTEQDCCISLHPEDEGYVVRVDCSTYDGAEEVFDWLTEDCHDTADEIERLRGALIQCGRAAGAGLADTASTDFLMLVPGEVEAKIERLRARCDTQAEFIEKTINDCATLDAVADKLRARVAELGATVNEWAGV